MAFCLNCKIPKHHSSSKTSWDGSITKHERAHERSLACYCNWVTKWMHATDTDSDVEWCKNECNFSISKPNVLLGRKKIGSEPSDRESTVCRKLTLFIVICEEQLLILCAFSVRICSICNDFETVNWRRKSSNIVRYQAVIVHLFRHVNAITTAHIRWESFRWIRSHAKSWKWTNLWGNIACRVCMCMCTQQFMVQIWKIREH